MQSIIGHIFRTVIFVLAHNGGNHQRKNCGELNFG